MTQNRSKMFWVISQPDIDGFCFNMGHFKARLGPRQDLDPKTAVPVLGIRPRPRSELKTLDTLEESPLSPSPKKNEWVKKVGKEGSLRMDGLRLKKKMTNHKKHNNITHTKRWEEMESSICAQGAAMSKNNRRRHGLVLGHR